MSEPTAERGHVERLAWRVIHEPREEDRPEGELAQAWRKYDLGVTATLRQQRDDLLDALRPFAWMGDGLPDEAQAALMAFPVGEEVARARALIKSITDAETGTEDDS